MSFTELGYEECTRILEGANPDSDLTLEQAYKIIWGDKFSFDEFATDARGEWLVGKYPHLEVVTRLADKQIQDRIVEDVHDLMENDGLPCLLNVEDFGAKRMEIIEALWSVGTYSQWSINFLIGLATSLDPEYVFLVNLVEKFNFNLHGHTKRESKRVKCDEDQ